MHKEEGDKVKLSEVKPIKQIKTMKQEKVRLLLVPVSECYVECFLEALSNHPEIEERLTYSDGCWESKETFDCIDNRVSYEYSLLEAAVADMGGSVREYMSFIISAEEA